MKKIPTLFQRKFEGHHIVEISETIAQGLESALTEDCVATVKFDGSCCMIQGNEFFKRYDAKHGKKAPDGAIPCCEPDPVTGHHPHWILIKDTPSDKWFLEARKNTEENLSDGTYEAIGEHFNGNPYKMEGDKLIKHGSIVIPFSEFEHTFEGIKKYLSEHYIEGIVFWKDGEPFCKIKRTDFGFEWNGSDKKR